MFELYQLRCFIAVASELNFRRAAKTLNMTQPPLSRQIQLLEHEVGARLLDRTSRSVRLTSAGRMFLPEARQLLNLAENAALTARRAQSGREGAIQLGFIPASAFEFLPSILAMMNRKAPNISVILREMMTLEQVPALRSGQLELGISRVPRDAQNLSMACVMREPFLLAMPKDHDFVGKKSIRLEDLADQRYIMYSPADGRYGYEIISGLFNSTGISPDFTQYIGQTHTIMAMINAGLGVSLVPAFTRSLGFPKVTHRDIDLPFPIAAELYLLWREETLTPIVQTVRDIILDQAPDIIPA